MTFSKQSIRVRSIQRIGIFFILIVGIGFQAPVFAQEEFFCPKEYEPENRTIPLGDQQISRAPVISKAVCTYYNQSNSKTTFEVSWSPSGKIYDRDWCVEKLTIENGIGVYQSKTHHVKITVSGIQPSENNYAQDFMQLLFVTVKDDAKLCNEKTKQPAPQIVKKEISEILANPKENTTSMEPIPETMYTEEKSINFPLELMAISILGGIGFCVFKIFNRR